jgi:diguanylate cyclase (GGDEF)-like protein
MSTSAERRREARHKIELAGRIEPPDGRQRGCLVLDYCSGGMLLHLRSPANNHFALGQSVRLHTEVLNSNGSQAVAIPARVAWIRDDHLGISFITASAGLVKALRLHGRLARGASAACGAPPACGEARCLARLRHVAQGVLPPLLRELLRKTGDDLLEAADRAESNSEQQQLFGDMGVLDSQRDADLLVRAVLERAFDKSTGAPTPATAPAEELALIDPDEFERWLEASRIATWLQRDLDEQLAAIGSRLATLRADATPGTFGVPLEPHHVTAALGDWAKRLELGTVSRQVLFDRAARMLPEGLRRLYDELDSALDNLGVPAARSRRHPLQEDASSTATTAPPFMADNNAETDAAVPTDAVRSPAVGAAYADLDPAATRRLLEREAEQRETLAREMLDRVSALPNMTESLGEWLGQLGGVLRHEAAADQGFFNDRSHPLRRIVDDLSHLQMFRASPDLDPAEDPLREQVSELLAPVGRGASDRSLLNAVAESLGRLIEEQSQRYQRRVERVVEACRGRDRVRRARLAVATELNRRYAGKPVPAVVPPLLGVGWRAVMELAWLDPARDTERYAAQLALLDGLVASLGGGAFDRGVVPPAPGVLFERIVQELESAAFDPFRRATVEDELRRALLDPLAPRPALVPMPVLEGGDEEAAPGAVPEGVGPGVWERNLARCASIAVGDRLKLLDEPAGRQDLRVAWIRDDRADFALVDHRGLRARDICLGDLALGLCRRRIQLRPVDGRPTSDLAVEAMLERMEQRLAYQAAHDSLTGLINRRQFRSALEAALAAPERADDAGVLLLMDLDQFRLVNDIHGYDTGDRLLVAVARLLEGAPGAKVLAHMGADRFAALLPDAGLADGEKWADSLRGSVGRMPFDWQGQALALSVSIGVVGFAAQRDGQTNLLQAGEKAISAAKGQGGDRVYLYRADDPDIARQKESAQWVVQVDDALDRGRLHLRCQPIVPLRPGPAQAPHYEVLLGVTSGSSELLPVAEFIEAAERYHRMRAVDRWVARAVMEWIAEHRDHMPALHGFAINLSGQTAGDPGFVEFVRQQFDRTGIDPAWVSFEVTETAAVADLTRSAGIIRALKAMGCKVALDDFGSGLASYAYLKELPVDWLKIDGVFVRKVVADQQDYAVVKSMNEIGHFLGKQTIAEYVADREILRRVREIGVDFAQGYAISPPLLLDELLDGQSSGVA